MDNRSKKPLNWVDPVLSEPTPVRKSHAERCEEYHRQGTPPTRRGAVNGQPPLAPNPYHESLSPKLTLGKSQPAPRVDHEAINKAREAALDQIFAKALGTPNVPLRPKQELQPPGVQPQGAQSAGVPQAPQGAPGAQQPPQGAQQPPQQQPPQQQPPQGAQQPPQGAQQPPQGAHQPQIPGSQGVPSQAGAKIPGTDQITPQLAQGPTQEPIGYTREGMPIYPDPFDPAHKDFQGMQHAEAAAQQMAVGNPQAAQVHEIEAQNNQSPMDRAAQMAQGSPPGMPLAKPTPPMGMSANDPEMKGTQQPYGQTPMGAENPDQGKPEAPPQVGAQRDGPKPGMHEQRPAVGGPDHGAGALPAPDAEMPEAGPGAGDPKFLEALQQWLSQQGQPDANTDQAPSAGSSTFNEPDGAPDDPKRPEKQTGGKAPMSHAASRGPIEPTAKK